MIQISLIVFVGGFNTLMHLNPLHTIYNVCGALFLTVCFVLYTWARTKLATLENTLALLKERDATRLARESAEAFMREQEAAEAIKRRDEMSLCYRLLQIMRNYK
jgi:hypothetical protein